MEMFPQTTKTITFHAFHTLPLHKGCNRKGKMAELKEGKNQDENWP